VVAKLAEHLATVTKPTDRIYMRGGRMQVYILSGRRSVTPFLYDFHYNVPPEQAYHYKPEKLKAIMAALEEHKPPYIVVTKRGKGKEVYNGGYEILDDYFPQFKEYLNANYEREEPWEAAPVSLMLFRRKDAE
jgi:hypothetical protein